MNFKKTLIPVQSTGSLEGKVSKILSPALQKTPKSSVKIKLPKTSKNLRLSKEKQKQTKVVVVDPKELNEEVSEIT